ncbi:streptophobe family protein [Streptomyces sp. CA-111067]|uniref:streptophobe family protein n=1 Tax=Streptomyces sp. CA-111067 TaxID=3240046 RepID=UPI003D9979CB
MTGRSTPWPSVLLSAVASVSWAFLGMAGVAALGLHLLGADAAGSLGPMTAAAVAMAVGGKVHPTGDIGAFGLNGSQTQAAIGITPLGVSLVGALLLAWVFLRSLRGAGVVVRPAELVARVVSTAVLFLAVLGGLAWAGQDTVAINGGKIAPPKGATDDLLNKLPGVGKISGGLSDGLQGLITAKTSVRFHVETGRTLTGGLVWVLVVLLIALLASRRSPLPAGWEAVHRLVRPAGSALAVVGVVAVAAGIAAAGYAAATGDEPGRIIGAALLGAPNGVWLAIPLGLFVPWKGTASGPLATLLPDPVNRLVAGHDGASITPGKLAELDGRVWLLPVAIALMMLVAGALTATRTPREPGVGRAGFVGRCALRLGVATALTLPLLVQLTRVKVNANLSVFGLDAVGAGVDLRGSLPLALLLGAVWGAAAGGIGALLALATGAAGQQAARLALPGGTQLPDKASLPGATAPPDGTGGTRPAPVDAPGPVGSAGAAAPGRAGSSGGADDSNRTYPEVAYRPGPYRPSPAYRPEEAEPNPYATGQPGAADSPTVAAPPSPRRRPPRDPDAAKDKWPEPPPPPPPVRP